MFKVFKNGICFIIGDIRCHGNLVYLVPKFQRYTVFFCGIVVTVSRITC